MEWGYFGEGGIKRARGSQAHLASTFQGGSCCVCRELTQLNGNFSVICQIKVAEGSLGWARWSLTMNLLNQLTNSHHTFGFKMPPLCPALGGPRPVWEGAQGQVLCLWHSHRAPAASAVQVVRHSQPSDDPRQQERLRRWGQRGWGSGQQSQLPKASEIRTLKLSTFSFAAQVYASWQVLIY